MEAGRTARTTTGRWTMKGRCEVMGAGNDSRGLMLWIRPARHEEAEHSAAMENSHDLCALV